MFAHLRGIREFLPVSASGSVLSPVEGSSAPCPSPTVFARGADLAASGWRWYLLTELSTASVLTH